MTDEHQQPAPALPTLRTQRLILRPFAVLDAPRVQQLAGAREIAEMTSTIPHPYPDGAAEEWIGKHAASFAEDKSLTLAVALADGGDVIGCVGLSINRAHQRAELGYWLGVPYWGKGYCTEAARALVRYGFGALGLHRICAFHFGHNPASGRVMAKIGMRQEGWLREAALKCGVFRDLGLWAILSTDTMPGEPS